MKVGEFELVEPVPELHDTRAVAMLRPWIDVGKVGTLALNRLEAHMGAKEVGRLSKPGAFFDFTRYRPRMGLAGGRRTFTTPNSIVKYSREQNGQDYLFLRIREPHNRGEDYAQAIVELLDYFGVVEYCRVGGMYDSVPHTRPLVVTATLGDEQAELAKGLVSTRKSTYQGPTSIVNLVADTLSRAETSTTSLMVHLPQYVQLDEDQMGASRILEVFCAVYGLPTELADASLGQQQYDNISRAVESNPEVGSLIAKLEEYYDRVHSGPSEEEEVSLSPDVESFLREMGRRLENDGRD